MGGKGGKGVWGNCLAGHCGYMKVTGGPVVDVLHTMCFDVHTSPWHSVHDAVECLVLSLAAGLQCLSGVAGCHCLVFPVALQAISIHCLQTVSSCTQAYTAE